MIQANLQKYNIRTRLRLLTNLSVLTYLLIALVMFFFFVRINSDINRVVEDQLLQTVENSRTSRDLGQFFSRLQLLGSSFYGTKSYLETEGAELRLKLTALLQGVKVPGLQRQIGTLQQQFNDYLRQCEEVNRLILLRKGEDADIDETLLSLEEIVAEKIVEQAQTGSDVSYFEQLTQLLSGYRESLLEIARKNAEEDHAALLHSSFDDPPPLATELKALALRLRTLTASEPPIDRFGRHLVAQVAYYQHLMKRYQQEMIHLGAQTQALQKLTGQMLQRMEQADQRSSQAGQKVRAEIRQMVLATGAVGLLLLTVMAALIATAHLKLFHNHIQKPMDVIRSRLQQFQQGDYSSPMPLDRTDEWGEIEAAFNEMVSSLVESMTALQESERRYRDIFDNASEGIFQSTLDGEFMAMNKALANSLGYENPQQAISALTDLRHQLYLVPEDRDQLLSRIRRQGFVEEVEYRMRRANGEVFWASLNIHMVPDGEGNEAFLEGTIDDITQRRSAEESLRQLQKYLQDIIDSMPSILIAIDVNLQVTLWNKQAEVVTGISAELATGQVLPQVLPLIESYLYLPTVNETLCKREPNRLQKIAVNRGEEPHYYDILVFPLSMTEASGAVIHIEETTERVQIEEMMVQSEKMLSVGGLAAGMAHEINNPLAAVLQNAQVMSQRLSPLLDKNRKVAEEIGIDIEQLDEYLKQRGIDRILQAVTRAGQRAARIVENMLTFSRKSTSSFIPRSLPDLLEQTMELAASDYDLKHNYDFRAIRVVREYQAVPDVPCEAGQMQQVLLNLLKNAAHALKETSNPQITLRIFLDSGGVCLQIEDNGPGMDEETRRRVFEPFYTTKPVGTGTGLGLSVAYFIISENHRGSMSVTSEPGRGSCFSLIMPVKVAQKVSQNA